MLLDDTHNATPASVIASLETLKTLSSNRRIAVLGDMLRLGDYEEDAHRQVAQKAGAGLQKVGKKAEDDVKKTDTQPRH